MDSKAQIYLRNVIFGISDSLVSTVGLLSGIDVSGTPKQVIILTGMVYAFVEAFSMAVGSFLSEQSAEEYAAKGAVGDGNAVTGGVIMFISFVVAAFIPIVPYLLFNAALALWISIVFSIAALAIVGLVSARVTRVRAVRRALDMALLGGAAIVIGVVVGKFIKAG